MMTGGRSSANSRMPLMLPPRLTGNETHLSGDGLGDPTVLACEWQRMFRQGRQEKSYSRCCSEVVRNMLRPWHTVLQLAGVIVFLIAERRALALQNSTMHDLRLAQCENCAQPQLSMTWLCSRIWRVPASIEPRSITGQQGCCQR